MQKINCISIIKRHINTLRDQRGRFLWTDVILFYLAPILIGMIAVFFLELRADNNVIELSVTVFSIFTALLFSVQVTIYSVSLRPLAKPDDPKKNKLFDSISSDRSNLIKELNDNISYLILLSVIIVSASLFIFIGKSYGEAVSLFVFWNYIHFLMTIMMVIKRASIVFSREYEG